MRAMKYAIWAILAVTLVLALPALVANFSSRGGVEAVLLLVGAVIVVALIGNFFRMSQRVDEIAKRK